MTSFTSRTGSQPNQILAGSPAYPLARTRIDEALGERVDAMLHSWLGDVGLLHDRFRSISTYGLGRFAMLCYPDAPSIDRLLLAAQYFAVLFSVDDHYCDDERRGCTPALLGERLTLALAVIDPVYLNGKQTSEFEIAVHSDPILVAWQSFMIRLETAATAAQVGRVRHEIVNMFLSMAGEASWRMAAKTPQLWEYATNRQFNGALPCTAIIDVVGDYEVPASVYYDAAVRKISIQAANAVMIGNDLFSARKEGRTKLPAYNLPRLVAKEQACSLEDGIEQSKLLYEDAVRTYECSEESLLQNSSSELKRYLSGLRSWIGGSLEWYIHTARYHL